MRDLKPSSSNSCETKKIRKILNEEIRLGINASSDTETEDVDITKEIYPLGHYINNREEMIEQMFSIIKGAKLRKMLPPLLKDTPLDELKADCLIHLLGMSKKRILSILEGREIKSSSDSESSSDNSASPKKKKPFKVQPIVIKQEGCSDISDNSEEVVLIDPDSNLLGESSKQMKSEGSSRKTKKRRKKEDCKKSNSDDQIKKSKKNRMELKKSNEDRKSDESHKSFSENENDEASIPTEGKNLLEILELEMRARAIRALLQKGGTPDVEDLDASNIDNPAIPVDLDDESSNEESSAKKITPAKNFRKKKKSNDDVIVITPKVVTIDLTEENDTSNVKITTKDVAQSDLELNNLLSLSDVVSKSPKKTDINSIESCSLINVNDTKNDNETNKSVVIPKTIESTIETSGIITTEINLEQAKSNWAQRWLESKEVKKVVSTSKICGNIRKRIKRAKLAQHNQNLINQDSCSSSPTVEQQEIQGSVGEYQSLPKSSKNVDNSVIQYNESSLETKELPLEQQREQEVSVEQVQDVTSTKNEFLKESNLYEDNSYKNLDETSDVSRVLISDISVSKVINTTTSNTLNLLDCTSSINNSKLDERNSNKVNAQSLDSNSESPTIEENSFDTYSNLTDFSAETTEYSSLSGMATASETNSDNNVTKILTLQSGVPLTTDKLSSTVTSSNTEGSELKMNTTNFPKHELNDKMVEIDINESERSGEICKILSSSTLGKDKIEKICKKRENSEPETLEIDITDEDRDIDGMMDEKV